VLIPTELLAQVDLALAEAGEESDLEICRVVEEKDTVPFGPPTRGSRVVTRYHAQLPQPEDLGRYTQALIEGLVRGGVLTQEQVEEYSRAKETTTCGPSPSSSSLSACGLDLQPTHVKPVTLGPARSQSGLRGTAWVPADAAGPVESPDSAAEAAQASRSQPDEDVPQP
jgi:hypothetical protein